MKNIKEIICSRRFLKGVDISSLILLNHIWDRDFSDISKMCEIKAIEKDILILKPNNSIIKNEIYFKKDNIIKEINKHFKKKIIRDIKFIS